MDQTTYDQPPIAIDRIPWSHLNGQRLNYGPFPTLQFMSLPGVGDLPIFVAQFVHKVSHFERETFALRLSGSPKHLQQIKVFTQNLIHEATALTSHLEDAELPDIKHLLTLIRDCERSGLFLLTYLHNLVANARAAILPNSREPILADLKWTPIRNLINTLRGLCASMEAAGLLNRCKNKKSVYLGPPSKQQCPSRSRLIIERDQNELQTHGEPPYTKLRDESLEAPAWGYRDTSGLLGSHTSQRSQVSPSSRQNTMDCIFDQRNSQCTVDAAQVFSSCVEWGRVFSQQSLPALVLYYATKPCEAALSAPVIPLDNASSFQSLLRLDRILQSSCYKLLDIHGPKGVHDTRLKFSGDPFDCGQAIVVSADELGFEGLRSKEISELIDFSKGYRNPDPLTQLASACLMVMKTTDPFHSPLFQRCLLYLAHILRHAGFSPETTQQYIDAISDTMTKSQASDKRRPIPWSALPQVGDSLHLKPELHCYADILTFTAREAIPLPIHMLPTYDESRRRFAITAHALASWGSCLPYAHPDRPLEPSLRERQKMLRYLLTHLTPSESTICFGKYSLWKEALRLCNFGYVSDPFQLLAIFLAKSERPDLLWKEGLRPSIDMGWNAGELLSALRGEASGAVAPQLFQMVVGQVEQMRAQTGGQSGQWKQERGDLVEWKGW